MGGRGSSSGSSNTAEKKLQKEYKTIDGIIKEFLNKKIPDGENFIILDGDYFTKAGIKSDDLAYVEIEKYTMSGLINLIRDNYVDRNKLDLDDETTISIQYKNGKFWHSSDGYKYAPSFRGISSIIVSDGSGEYFAGKVVIENYRKYGSDTHDLRVDHIYPKKNKK